MSMGRDRTSSLPGDGARLCTLLAGMGDVTATDETGSEISVEGVSLLGDATCDRVGAGCGREKGAKDRR